jgi:hypothetical protein
MGDTLSNAELLAVACHCIQRPHGIKPSPFGAFRHRLGKSDRLGTPSVACATNLDHRRVVVLRKLPPPNQ